ncbi:MULTISPECIES: MFS transporter [unclassified Aureimonas]|uniref:MFS transporter n=1 Tax=unclassified Aureimonas TaxID=2615206 RepID=UPI0006FDC1B1|nr:MULTISPECIES: MFS transporter [unclassified Aureimonas]KQT61215.1 hypothetical protein ASG54_24035 [Aureimonas sp. Leaf460]KQT68664.1 hypothetical protein ASG62_18790 [Aureimonas sp. Leaf427]
MNQHVASTWRQWLAVSALGVGSFAIVTTELAPVGLLTPIGVDLNQPESTVGLAVTLYAWIGAVAALVSATTLSALPRRPLLLGLMLVLAASAVGSGIASSFGALMAARVVGALAHGAFWAMIGTLGAQIVPAKHLGLATSIIFGGVSAASVAGVPLASYLGSVAGWRMSFFAIAVLSLGIAVAIRVSVPSLLGQAGVDTGTMRRIMANRRFQRIFAVTIVSITAHFMAFTFIEPYLRGVLNVSPTMIAILLFVFGVAGLLANVFSGALIDAHMKTLVVGALLVAALALAGLALPFTATSASVAGVFLFAWGAGIAVVLVGLQTWVIKEAGSDALPASAIYVALFNAAIGLGAVLGSVILAMSGIVAPFIVASVMTAISLLGIAVVQEPQSLPAPAE